MRQLPKGAHALATQTLKDRPGFIGRNRLSPLSARFTLHRMSLVNNPVTNGRQNLSVRRDISKKKRMVCDHDIGTGRAAARSMNQTTVWKERTEASCTLTRCGCEVGAVHTAPAYAQSIKVPIGRLAGKGINNRNCRESIRRVFIRFDFAR